MRASKLTIIGLLALFSFESFALNPSVRVNYLFADRDSAMVALYADYATESSHHSGIGTYINNSSPEKIAYYGTSYLYYYWGCPAGQAGDSEGRCYVLPTDEECESRPHITSEYSALIDGEYIQPASFVVEDGCSYSLTVDSVEQQFPDDNCYLKEGDITHFYCSVEYGGTGSTSSSLANDGIGVTAPSEQLPNSGGDSLSTNSTGPLTTQADAPSTGDTTTEQIDIQQIDFSDQLEVGATSDTISVTRDAIGGGTETLTTTTITYADGSSETTIEAVSTQEASTTTTNIIDKNTGSTSTTTTTTPSTSGTTTTTTSKDSSGTTTGETTTKTGTDKKGNTGAEQQALEGNCAPGEECEVKLSAEGLDNTLAGTEVSKFESAVDGKHTELLDSITADENGDSFGIESITEFANPDTFFNNYFVLPSPTCSGGINTTIFGRPFVIEPCEKLQPLRDVLAWVFFILTAFTIIKILTRGGRA